MNKTLKHLDTWLSLNKYTINSKTNYLIFNNNKAKLSIILNNRYLLSLFKKKSIKLLKDTNWCNN